jgi:threonine dehydrogenase-like Zn-dependent dehydrogenase
MDARAFWVLAPGEGAIRRAALPARGPGDVVVETLFTAVSRGTEALVFRGGVPESQRIAMRAPFQEGDFPGPVKYGYINVGRLLEGPPALAPMIGRPVFCLYPHQTRYVVPATAVVLLPEGVPPERAVLAANMETAINVVWDCAPGPGDRVGIIGAGVVGALASWLIGRIPGCEVTLIDIDENRRALADALGVGFATPDGAPCELDRVVHASGSPEGLATALRLAAFEAVIVEASWFGDRQVSMPLGEAFHSRRLTIRASQVGHVASRQRARWTYTRRMELALRLLRDPVLGALVTGEDAFDALPAVMARLAAAPAGALCHRIRYPAD